MKILPQISKRPNNCFRLFLACVPLMIIEGIALNIYPDSSILIFYIFQSICMVALVIIAIKLNSLNNEMDELERIDNQELISE